MQHENAKLWLTVKAQLVYTSIEENNQIHVFRILYISI